MKIRPVFLSFFSLLLLASCTSPKNEGELHHAYTNQLIHTNSPYLLQHAHNPVNWYPWGEAALEKAKAEDKMLLISVGYAACHWCHVMEHESFEDTTVARIMNEHFVSIKVDREERPDIDAIYMTACQMASDGGCGWPLNSFALPDGRPVWAGTYFPKKNWIELLQYFIELREKSPEKLEAYASQLTDGMKELEDIEVVKTDDGFSIPASGPPVKAFFKTFDYRNGGREGVQKFPMPNNYEWLLQYSLRTGQSEALAVVELTLDRMAAGGIHDQIGGGFARYTTDPKWKVPHFEKMLYDNAQLAGLYAKAYQATGKEDYRSVLEAILSFVKRGLTGPEGNFYASLDADSEGEEGKFYVWTQAEIDSLLLPVESKLVTAYFQTSKRGNWEDGKNILHRAATLNEMAAKLSIEPAQAEALLQSAREKLMKARSQRVAPGLDDKSLCSWNALMLEAYTQAYRATQEEAYREAALRNGNFIMEQLMQPDARLQRNYKDGSTSINGFLDDYAHTMAAFLALYQITFDEDWLAKARRLADYAITHFRDTDSGFFFYTSDLDPPLLVRKIELEDNVIPSSNSAMARALLQLGHYFYEGPYLEMAQQMMNGMREKIMQSDQPSFYSNWHQLYLELAYPTYEIAIVGSDNDQIRREMQQSIYPQALYLGSTQEGGLPLLENKWVEGETMVYVCLNKVCKLPVTTAEAAKELIK